MVRWAPFALVLSCSASLQGGADAASTGAGGTTGVAGTSGGGTTGAAGTSSGGTTGAAGTGGGGITGAAGTDGGGTTGAAGNGGAGAGGATCIGAGGGPPPGPLGSGSRTAIEDVRAIPIAEVAEATACSRPVNDGGFDPYADRCGCNGLTCAAGQKCLYAILEMGAGCGQPLPANSCFRACTRDADCAADEICLPKFKSNDVPVCFKPRCRSSAECCNGRCAVITGYRSQCHPDAVLSIECG